MMGSLPFGPPYPVSPVIRGARFAFLFAGIIYGRIKLTKYRADERKWRAEEEKRKVIRDKENAALRAKLIVNEELDAVNRLQKGMTPDSEPPKGDNKLPKGVLVPPAKPCENYSIPPTAPQKTTVKAKPCEFDPHSSKESVKTEGKAKPRVYDPNSPEAVPISAAQPEQTKYVTKPKQISAENPESSGYNVLVPAPKIDANKSASNPNLPKAFLIPALKPNENEESSLKTAGSNYGALPKAYLIPPEPTPYEDNDAIQESETKMGTVQYDADPLQAYLIPTEKPQEEHSELNK